jgi:hypothetical protein
MPRTSTRPTGSAAATAPDHTVDLSAADTAIPAPRPLTDFEHTALATAIGADSPTLVPPGAGTSTVSVVTPGTATGTWTSGVKVNALWAQFATRNAYMSVQNVGWVKIFNGTDAAFLALTTLAAQAKQTQSQVVYRTEADGMVHEIYLW